MTDTTNTLPPLPANPCGSGTWAKWTGKEAHAIQAYGLQCFEAGRQQGRVNSSGLERELFLVLSDPYTSLSDGAMRTIHHVCNQLHAASTPEPPKAQA